MAAQDGQYGPDGEWRQGPGCMSSSSASECLQGAVRDGVRRCPAARGSMPGAHSGLVHLRALVLAPPSAHLRWVVRRGQRAGGGIGGGSGCTPHEDGMCDGALCHRALTRFAHRHASCVAYDVTCVSMSLRGANLGEESQSVLRGAVPTPDRRSSARGCICA